MKKTLQKDNFESLKISYACEIIEDNRLEMAEIALRNHAKQFSGCISCVFSRNTRKGNNPEDREFWTSRKCILGLKQETCNSHMEFPKIKIEEEE